MRRLLIAATASALLAVAAPAQAHIQVRPVQAAPGDPVLWTVLVPSEEPAGTREVELAVPKDVLPFSFEDVPGWTRVLRKNPDGSVRSIVWRGHSTPDGLATFRFLASTPERDGVIAWKAIQTYRDGDIVRWIGSPDSEHPAATTKVSSTVPRENAGGEGAAEAGGDGGTDTAKASAAASAPAASDGDDDDGPLALILAGAGLVLGAIALVVALRRPRPG